jgi:class 3 adenylate cyclase/CheY-like chemotaxis protein
LRPDGPRILVVDDNEDNRYTLLMMLELQGYEHTGTATCGREALALIKSETFGVVLLDMMMPDINGDAVLRQIKADPETRDISVVMISADTDATNISRCIELGADDYLPKPFNPAILRARIVSSLQKQALRRVEADYTAKIEAEKRKSETLLRNVLPREIAFRLLGGESDIADLFEDATVIFADVVGFTQITARMRPYETVACLNRLFTQIDVLAEDLGVEKIKTIGDCYMAVAGVPSPQENHKRIATNLALRMVAAAEDLSATLPAPFTLRVGLHSGPVMAGVIGTRRFAYDVWGDTVNIAARLESASRPRGVLASSTTAGGLGGGFSLEGPRPVGLKDGRVVEAFFVTGSDRL